MKMKIKEVITITVHGLDSITMERPCTKAGGN